MDKHVDDSPGKIQPTSEPTSASQTGLSWRAALVVALILLVGAVVGHSLLRNGSTPPNVLPCGKSSVGAACPASGTCPASQPAPAGTRAEGVCAQTCTAGDCCAQQAVCPHANTPGCPTQPCCATNATVCPQQQTDQTLPCCTSPVQE